MSKQRCIGKHRPWGTEERVAAWHVKDNLANILQQMVGMGLIYKSE